ncbi:MAG: acylphosphatase [Erysipelotrichaceae bacterium]|nr:acylphosphatase [Erysipelotrichaceae bacterium]MBO4538152.1 acylphosphatase [Erysipelotrichaceae bacterium]
MKRYYVIFEGQVQGVGFRWVISRLASLYNLTGWVRNRDDGRVDCELQGDITSVFDLIAKAHEASYYVHIDDYSVREIEPLEHESSFRVRF